MGKRLLNMFGSNNKPDIKEEVLKINDRFVLPSDIRCPICGGKTNLIHRCTSGITYYTYNFKFKCIKGCCNIICESDGK